MAESTPISASCINPIRLRGFYQRIDAATGEVLALVGSPDRGDGTLLVSCKDRRASCCAPCARLYERDAYQLLAAGLRGGKNVPATVATHPAVLLTLTAPSFGAVHGNRDGGRPCTCGRRHDPDDPQLGTPIYSTEYRYADQVIWNHYAPQLWKRTVQAMRRHLALALGTHRSQLPRVARIVFAKVAEFQRRGVVHYHAVIRIDGHGDAGAPPPARCTTALLEQAIRAAVDAARVPLPDKLRKELAPDATPTVRWGAQCEIAALDPHSSTAAAGYIAKYTTKATEAATGGTLLKPIRSRPQLDEQDLPEHVRALVTTAWTIDEHTGIEGFKRWAHQFGYGGHTLTKSRRYSVTFSALRHARSTWHQATDKQSDVVVRANLTYAGRGQGPA